MKVGFIGLGNMGMPMSKNLLKAGFELTVHNRSRGKVDEIARLGATSASSSAEVTLASDIVLTCLPDVATVEHVFLGDEGILNSVRPGQVLVDHSTVGPSTSKKITQEAQSMGAYFLDAPVSGLVTGATEASLTIMVGGEKSAYEKALPVFQALGRNIYHVEPSGAGIVTKLTNQLLFVINALAAAEVFHLAVKVGADPRLMLDIWGKSSGQSFSLSYMATGMLSRDFDGGVLPFRMLAKDLGLAYDLAQEARTPLPAGTEAVKIFQAAASKGMAENDVSAMLLLLEELAERQASTNPPDVQGYPVSGSE